MLGYNPLTIRIMLYIEPTCSTLMQVNNRDRRTINLNHKKRNGDYESFIKILIIFFNLKEHAIKKMKDKIIGYSQ